MANFELIGQDASPNAPDTPMFKPGPPPKWSGDQSTGPQPTKAGDADDSGALWWDHDDAGQNGHQGYDGAQGVLGGPGANGGSTPFGVRFTITQTILGVFTIELHGGNGQPGGKGGPAGDGGEGQDGGNSDDEQPAGLGGRGGTGGKGGTGGSGGNAGDINEFYLTIGVDINVSQIHVQYDQGRGGGPGPGGDPGNGGPGGVAGAGNGQRQVGGFQGPFGDWGPKGADGKINYVRVTA